MFIKYQHVERFGSDEVEGIEFGECFIFPKIDGTNGQIWFEENIIKCGSRNRELAIDNDNQGFMEWTLKQKQFHKFFLLHPNLRLYGEWLVPHTVKTYKEDAWRKFYVFDVIGNDKDGESKYLSYEEYKPLLEECGIDYIPCIATVTNGKYDTFVKLLEKNNYLVKDGEGYGEGIVIKRYDYKNKFNRVVWAKIVTSEFKEKHVKEMGAPNIKGELVIEDKFINDYCTEAFVKKEYEKIKQDGWTSKKIPQLLGTTYHILITESIWDAIKKYRYPKIDFQLLNRMCIAKIKQILPEIF